MRIAEAGLAVVAGLLVMSLTPLAVGNRPWEACVATRNYTANSTYGDNLGLAAAALPFNVSTSPSFFATTETGAAPNKVYALGRCLGNQDASACRDCIASIFDAAQKLCPDNRGATITSDSDQCLLGFSDQDFLASTTNAEDQELSLYSAQNVSSDIAAGFNASAYELLSSLAEYVATTNSTSKYVTGAIGFDATYPNIYGAASCTPDLTPGQCRGCLDATISEMPREFISNTKGARINGLRCTVRYEVYHFNNDSIMLQLPGIIQPGKKSNKTGKFLAIIMPTVAAIVAGIAIFLCCRMRRTKTKRSLSFASHMEDIESIESLLIDLATLRIATDNFSDNNKIGEGGFGAVYKGSLPNGQEIAVKRLSQNSRQGMGELRNELLLIAKLQHKNLVRLVGVCLQEEEKLLVYEYMPNKSLDNFLFDSEKRKGLEWGRRLTIINGIARGLQYLHEDSQLKVVHRDLKASNVLLDAAMSPKISDFGLARLFGGDQSQDTTNRVVGTYGYMAPEYALRGQYSMKSDIYSFGVLVLEILTGKRNSDTYNTDQPIDLPCLIWDHWTMKSIAETIDPPYCDSEREDILRCVHIGLSCVQEDPARRPTISAINIMLESNTVPSQAPSRPAFYVEMSGDVASGMYSLSYPGALDESTSKVTAISSPNELSITDPEPR